MVDDARSFPGNVPGRTPASPGEAALPGMVAVPAHPSAPGSGRLFLEARETPGLGRVLPVFSSVRRLVAALGPDQPWVVLSLARARHLAAAGGVERVALDPAGSPGGWRWSPSNLADFTRARRPQ